MTKPWGRVVAPIARRENPHLAEWHEAVRARPVDEARVDRAEAAIDRWDDAYLDDLGTAP
jgi:hypothetical protein